MKRKHASMKCAVLGTVGAPLVDALVLDERPVPEPGQDEVLIKVLAAGVNPSDFKATTGAFPYAKAGSICGRDCCGRVVQGPPELLDTIVWSTAGKDRGLAGDGGLAEFSVLPVQACLPLPKGVSITEAAAMGVPLCTAAVILSKVQIKAGETVLVTGANGQVARFVLGLARWKGARTVGIVRRNVDVPYADKKVVGTVDESIIDQLKELGSVDAVVDTVGIGTEHLIQAASHGGRIVLLSSPTASAAFPVRIRDFYRKDLTLLSAETMQHSAVKSADFVKEFLPAFGDGAVSAPSVHSEIFPLSDVHKAYELTGKGCSEKVVVAPGGLEELS